MKFDIVIVGGSTAGLHVARILAEQGKRVGVFERQSYFRTERRTLIVTHALGDVLGGIPEEIDLHHIEVMKVASQNGETAIRLQYPDPIVERAAMMALLTQRAVEAGAEILCGWRFKGFGGQSKNGSGQAELLFENLKPGKHRGRGNGDLTEIQAAEAVIGADGVRSDVAVAAGIGQAPCVPLIQAECPLPAGWDPHSCKVWFNVDQTKYFYWLIPESDELCVVGLIGEKGVPVRQLLDRFLDRMGLEPQAWQGAQVAMHHPRLKPWTRLGELPVYLVGDAAGQVKVTTVGGTVTGFQGAEAACRAILHGTTYRQELRAVKRELDLHWCIRWALERLDNKGYDHLVKAVSGGAREFLGKYDRDSMVSVFWKLPFVDPQLIPVGLRCLLGNRNGRGRHIDTPPEDVPEDI